MKISAEKITQAFVCDTANGQDGAIYGGYMFRFDHDGSCRVFAMDTYKEISAFRLDKSDLITAHCNAVCFGSDFYDEKDSFPLLYANVYNSYMNERDRMEGVCCVYRITNEGKEFSSKLVQIIKIGFTENLDLWKSLENNRDLRPYGNFVVDTDRKKYYGFVMRDKEKVTRFFEFDLPEYTAGTYSGIYGANVLTLNEEDIINQFDCEYSSLLQGACYYDGKIFSVEGGTVPQDEEKRKNFPFMPRLLIADAVNRKQFAFFDLYPIGLDHEPEFICYYDGKLYYSDIRGKVYTLSFE